MAAVADFVLIDQLILEQSLVPVADLFLICWQDLLIEQ